MLKKSVALQIFALILGVAVHSDLTAQEPIAKVRLGNAYRFTHQSALLKELRRYMVSLPERYYVDQKLYPALYIIDADFQFEHVSAVVRNMARMGKIMPMIVIGVATQGQDDYIEKTTWPINGSLDYGGAESFQRYIAEELVPLVNHQYRTNKNKNVLAGYSLGALFSLYSLMQNNTPFSAFVSMSPSVWFDDYAMVSRLPSYIRRSKNVSPLFLSVANEQGMGVERLTKALSQSSEKSRSWLLKKYPDESHYSTALPALYDALKFLNPDFYEDTYDLQSYADYRDVLSLFKKKEQNWAGFKFGWLQAYTFAKYVFISKQQDKALEIAEAIKRLFPDSYLEVVVQLAKAFNIKQQPEIALKLLRNVDEASQNYHEWHQQLNLSLEKLGDLELARQHKEKALDLATKHQLESWEIWELD